MNNSKDVASTADCGRVFQPLSAAGRKECLNTPLLQWGRMNLMLLPRVWTVTGSCSKSHQHPKCPQAEPKIYQRSAKRHINHLYAHRLNMLPLYGLPGLPETKPELKGYSVGLLTMYITHTAGTAVSLPCYNPSTGKP